MLGRGRAAGSSVYSGYNIPSVLRRDVIAGLSGNRDSRRRRFRSFPSFPSFPSLSSLSSRVSSSNFLSRRGYTQVSDDSEIDMGAESRKGQLRAFKLESLAIKDLFRPNTQVQGSMDMDPNTDALLAANMEKAASHAIDEWDSDVSRMHDEHTRNVWVICDLLGVEHVMRVVEGEKVPSFHANQIKFADKCPEALQNIAYLKNLQCWNKEMSGDEFLKMLKNSGAPNLSFEVKNFMSQEKATRQVIIGPDQMPPSLNWELFVDEKEQFKQLFEYLQQKGHSECLVLAAVCPALEKSVMGTLFPDLEPIGLEINWNEWKGHAHRLYGITPKEGLNFLLG